MGGLTSSQRAAVIGDAAKQVVAIAVKRQKPIAIEKLDFSKKKASLESERVKHARMLSAFAYSRIQATIRARAFDAGVDVLDTNPAFSSLIGRYKFASRYGLSAHGAAACIIARRVRGLGEKLPNQFRVTPPLLAKNRGRHVWNLWAILSRRDRAAHGALRRPGRKTRSPAAPIPIRGSTARSVIPPPHAGGNPAREPAANAVRAASADTRFLEQASRRWGNRPLSEITTEDVERIFRGHADAGHKIQANRW